LSFSKD
nr:Chain A, Beta-2-microglobulin segment LSFSKD [unidentified]3LOZ_B Chain B, Beta-2-microglobulin segment LSFSKD [unidentified]3LOZ_C Chain C, Beta-2-microglobulin segment LSFSKD [unidentified]3LOZ_D Chain D, Beta-2-microglobulin segment LSFSKD [unidentified]